MDPNQNPEDGEKTEDNPLGRQRTSLSMPPSHAGEPMPQQVRELKPISIVDDQGNLVGLRFVNSDGGGLQTNVMAGSQIFGGAVIYKGSGWDAVYVVNRHKGPYYMLSLSSSQHWYNATAVGMRSAPMTLRFVFSVNRDAKPMRQVDRKKGMNRDRVVILMPRGGPLFPMGYPRPELVMEGMLVGRSYAEASQMCQFHFREMIL